MPTDICTSHQEGTLFNRRPMSMLPAGFIVVASWWLAGQRGRAGDGRSGDAGTPEIYNPATVSIIRHVSSS